MTATPEDFHVAITLVAADDAGSWPVRVATSAPFSCLDATEAAIAQAGKRLLSALNDGEDA